MTNAASAGVSDEVLVGAARHGDLYAWERLVRRYQEPAYRVAYLLTRASGVAEAATEAAFIRGYRALPGLADGTPVAPWLLRIVIGEARLKRRESSRTRSTSRPVEPLAGPQLPATPIPGLAATREMTPLERDAVIDAFDRLAEEDRLVIAGRYLLGLSREDAAAALSLPVALIEQHLRDALVRLRKRLGLV